MGIRSKTSRPLAALVLGIGGSIHLGLSLTVDEALIDPFEIRNVCQPIDGEHAVSIQAAVQYKLAGDDKAGGAVYGNPIRKQFQSFECGKTIATIYYYEYRTRDELRTRLESIKHILWGEPGPTTLHPELVLDLENLLVIISSRKPQLLYLLLSHRVTFPDLSDASVDDRITRLRCGTPKDLAPELCSALQDFRRGTYPQVASGEIVLVGRSWEVSEDSEPSQVLSEALYIGQIPEAGSVASFGQVKPENEDERDQILRQMEAQKEGKVAGSAQPLITFLRDAYGKTKARTQNSGGRSLGFIGLGNRVYVRSAGGRLVLVTDLMSNGRKRPYVVAAFEVGTAPK